MNKYSKDLFYDIIENHGITTKQGKRFLTSWNDIRANLNCPFFGNRWDDLESRRPMTRDFYEHLLTKPSGFMTKAAKDILNDPLLDKEEKKKLTTADHVLSGQTWGTFVIAKFEELFEDNFSAYVKECLTASQTVVSTVEENNRFKDFTVNDETFEAYPNRDSTPYIKEYNFWYKYFNTNIKRKLKNKFNFVNLIPSCGEGARFSKENKSNFKPLIKVDNKYMIAKAIDSLPKTNKNVVIMREDHNKKYKFSTKLKSKIKNIEILKLKNKTSGMATTCFEYLKNYNKTTPILISSCDYAVIFDEEKFQKIINFFNPDVIIWTFKGYPDARITPFAYAYCEIKNGAIHKISEKTPISDAPHLDHIAQGIFYFKSKKIFIKAFKKIIKNKNKINNEYYVGNSINELIKENYNVIPFEVEQYICLGTLKDLKVYNFWSGYFNDKI